MFYCVRAFRVFIWFTQVVGLQSKQHRYWRWQYFIEEIKLVSVVHLITIKKIQKKSNLAYPVPAGLLPLCSESVFILLSSFHIPTLKSWSVLSGPFIQPGGSWTLRKFGRLSPSGEGSVKESDSLLLMLSGSHSPLSKYHTKLIWN